MSHSETTAAAPWSYRPGPWYGVFGAATSVVLPPAVKERVGPLWSLVDDGGSFEEVLDLLLKSGLASLPGFVLVGTIGGSTQVLVRGAAVTVEVASGAETSVVDGASAATWVERTFEDVTSIVVQVIDPDPDPDADAGVDPDSDYAIVGGLVRVSRVDHPAVVEPPSYDDHPSYGDHVAAPASLTGQLATEELGAEEPAGQAPVTDGVVDELDDVEELEADDEPATELLSTLDEPGLLGNDLDTTNVGGYPLDAPIPATPPMPPMPPTTPTPPPPPLPPAPAPAPPTPPESDHDGLTQAGANPREFARSQPGIPGQPMAPSVTNPVAKLVISSGETLDVDRVVLIGRAPEARRFTSTEQPRLVTVPSPLHEISSTHIEVRPGSGADHGSAVVTDMGSTNGTVLVQPGLGPEDLKPGIAVQLIPGATINLGDGVTIHVTRP